jgi:hypothetical protein
VGAFAPRGGACRPPWRDRQQQPTTRAAGDLCDPRGSRVDSGRQQAQATRTRARPSSLASGAPACGPDRRPLRRRLVQAQVGPAHRHGPRPRWPCPGPGARRPHATLSPVPERSATWTASAARPGASHVLAGILKAPAPRLKATAIAIPMWLASTRSPASEPLDPCGDASAPTVAPRRTGGLSGLDPGIRPIPNLELPTSSAHPAL